MEYYRPGCCGGLHAAAHKHYVPLMEDVRMKRLKIMCLEPIKTARAADKYGVKNSVLISTRQGSKSYEYYGRFKTAIVR